MPSTFAALSIRDFRLLWSGLTLSTIGTWMQTYGLGWLVVQLAVRDGSPQLGAFYIGLVGLSRAVPGLGFGLFGGVIADRFDRRRLLTLTQAAGCLLSLVLGLLTLADRVNIVTVLAFSTLLALASSIESPTRQAMVPGLVGARNLPSAVGLNAIALNSSTILGPLIGGVLIVSIGVGGLMLVNATSYLALIGMLRLMNPLPYDPNRRAAGIVQALRDGLAYVRRDELVRTLLLVFASSTLLVRSAVQLLPAFAHDSLNVGAVELSWMIAAVGAGGIVSALLASSLGRIERRGLTILGAHGLSGVALIVLAMQHDLPPALAFLVLIGAGALTVGILINITIQLATPDALRGRVASMPSLLVDGGIPFGTLLVGSLATLVGIATALGLAGFAIVVTSFVAMARGSAIRDATVTSRV